MGRRGTPTSPRRLFDGLFQGSGGVGLSRAGGVGLSRGGGVSGNTILIGGAKVVYVMM